MKKLLLTGGSGFIGRNINESFLNELYEIHAPSSSELNLADEKSVEKYFLNREFDAVLHCACKPGHRNAKDHNALCETNVRMFENLVRFKDSYGKFVNFGSGAIYDISKDITDAVEEDIYKNIGDDEHGKCKYIVSRSIEDLSGFVDLNIFGVFGRYEDYSIRFISNAICKTLFDLPITIRQNRRFSYLYISDLFPILQYFIENDAAFHSYNIVPDEKTQLSKIAGIVKEISGKNMPVLLSKEGFGLDYTGENKRLKNEFVKVNFTNLYNAIEELYDWYAQNKAQIDVRCLLTDK